MEARGGGDMVRLLLLTTLALAAQTRLPVEQLRAPPGQVRIVTVDAEGRVALLPLGAGLAVEGGMIVSRVPLAPIGYTLERIAVALTPAPDGTYPAIPGGAIYRNGLLMSPAVDYAIADARVVPREPWTAADIVVAESYRIVAIRP